MMRLRIWRNPDGEKRRADMTRKRRGTVWAFVVAVGLALVLARQAITAIVEGDYVMGENYLGQPVGPGLQLIGLAVALFVAVAMAWQYFHPKPESKGKRKKVKPFFWRWPHDIP
jgi:hypothetical protein